MSMTNLLISLCIVAVVIAMGYLAACAAAERWLTPREWWGTATCRHTHGVLVSIEYDGEAVYECTACGKHVRKPL